MHRARATLPFAILILATAAAGQQTVWVDAAAGPGGDGSQANPFATIQAGIDASSAGFTVRVMAGTYAENVDFAKKNILVEAVGQAVIDGGGTGPCVQIDGPDYGAGATQELSGFTLQNGAGALLDFVVVGGGLLVVDASPRITSCTVVNCQADNGGGMAFSGSSAQVALCEISQCLADRGGGLYAEDGAIVVANTMIHDNQSSSLAFCNSGSGGGVYVEVDASSSLLQRCEIYQNSTVLRGGGVFGGTLFDCDVWDNLAAEGGGVADALVDETRIFSNDARSCDLSFNAGGGAIDCVLTDCEIRDNEAWDFGGGVATCSLIDCELTGNRVVTTPDVGPAQGGGAWKSDLIDCVVSGNEVTVSMGQGGGVWAAGGERVERTQVFENEADEGAGVYGSADLFHTVVWGNVGAGAAFVGDIRNSVVRQNSAAQVIAPASVTYSNVEGGAAGTGNFDAPALFWAPAGGGRGSGGNDFHLMTGSPCIDTGDPGDPTDPDGSVADVGVFPFDPSWFPAATIYCTAVTSAQGCLGAIAATGAASLTSSALTVSAANLPDSAGGLVFYGGAAAALPYLGGTLCVQPPLGRTPIQFSGGSGLCSGSYSFNFGPAFFGSIPFFAAGDNVFAQYWLRDSGQPGSNPLYTDAVWFVVLP